MTESTPPPEATPPEDQKTHSLGLRIWVLAVPLALAAAVLIPLALDLHLLWALPIYIVTGILTGLTFATYAAFRGRRRKLALAKKHSEQAQLELEQTGS